MDSWKRFRLLCHRLFYHFLENRNIGTVRLGEECAWNICLDMLDENSAVICAGVGNDISFEIELHNRTGATVILLDPSPTGQRTIANTPASQMGGIRYLTCGLAARSGASEFALPSNSEEGSYAYTKRSGDGISFECKSVMDLMREFGFDRVDILKMDIEGFEWDVLRAILKERLPVSQICVEFHNLHGRLLSGLRRYLMLIRMRLYGYYLIHHVGTGDHTFLKKGCEGRADESKGGAPQG